MSVPPVFRTLYLNLESVKYAPASTVRWYHHFLHSPRAQLILGYYLVLALTVFFTATFLRRTGVIASLMSASRDRVSAQYHGYTLGQDRSSFRLTTTLGLVALVTAPDGALIGETADGLRFHQIPDAVISPTKFVGFSQLFSQRRLTAWGLVIPQPSVGEYTILLSSGLPGTYFFSVYVADPTGIETATYQEVITLSPAQTAKYSFVYQPQNPTKNSHIAVYPRSP